MPSVILAFSVFCAIEAVICSSEALVSSTPAACSLAAWLSDCAVALTSSEALASASALMLTSPTTCARRATVPLMLSHSSFNWPWHATSAVRVRSPSSIALSTWRASFSGPITASKVWLMPSTMRRKSPWCRPASARTSRRPAPAASTSRFVSRISARRLARTCSMVSLMNAFLPGKVSSGASKLPRPNSAIQAIAFFLTAMWPPTMRLMPSAIVRKSPSNRLLSMVTSMSPASCSADIWFICAISPSRLRRTCSMVSLINAFLPGKLSSGAWKLPRPNSAMQAMAFFLTAMWPPTMRLMPSAMLRKSPSKR